MTWNVLGRPVAALASCCYIEGKTHTTRLLAVHQAFAQNLHLGLCLHSSLPLIGSREVLSPTKVHYVMYISSRGLALPPGDSTCSLLTMFVSIRRIAVFVILLCLLIIIRGLYLLNQNRKKITLWR